ncbi:MAG: hypothetical protein GWP19_09470 [Planctomycetia bacterium]|nr:hypothetical protein [Planctomycetia bacterium]
MNIFTDLEMSSMDRVKVSFIRSGISQGLSGASILRSLRQSPLGGMRRTDFFKIIRTIKRVNLQRPYVRSLKHNVMFDPERLEPSPYNHEKSFNFIVHGKITDSKTGEEKHVWVTVSSDAQFTGGEAMAIGKFLIEKGDSWGPGNALDVDLENIYLGNNYEG